MIPRLVAPTPQRLTRFCRPTAARAITCQKRIPSGILGAASNSPAASSSWQPRSRCSCVGSSTLASVATSPCCAGGTAGVDQKLQTRGNSIAVSAAATLLGGHHSHQYEYEPSEVEIAATTDPAKSSFLGEEGSLLTTIKKINAGVGRKRNRAKTARPKRINSIQQILDQLSEATAHKSQKEQTAKETIDGGPTLDRAQAMPLSCRQMDNASLMYLAAMDNLEARAEVVRRHIMDVDNCSYSEACKTYIEIRDFNRSILSFAHTAPYRIGITTATVAAFASIPLCFHLPSVEFFNANFVNLDAPEPESVRTWLGVGAWSWQYMEPILGQLSFAILCLQVARNQLGTIGHKPYSGIIRQWRARKLTRQFPRYDETILSSYSIISPLVSPTS